MKKTPKKRFSIVKNEKSQIFPMKRYPVVLTMEGSPQFYLTREEALALFHDLGNTLEPQIQLMRIQDSSQSVWIARVV